MGIAPAHVAAAAAELDSRFPNSRSGPLGAPTAFRYERWIDGELSRDGIGQLFDIARRDVGPEGAVSEAFDTIDWRGVGQTGMTAGAGSRDHAPAHHALGRKLVASAQQAIEAARKESE